MKVIRIEIQEWSEGEEDIIRDRGIVIEGNEDFSAVMSAIRAALDDNGYEYCEVD